MTGRFKIFTHSALPRTLRDVELALVQTSREQLRGFEQWATAAGHSPQTMRLRRHYLSKLIRSYPETPLIEMTADQLSSFLAHPSWKPETRKSARASVRAFYIWAMDTDVITVDPSRRLPRVRVPSGAPRPAPEDVFLTALLVADDRGRLLLMLAGYEGLRRAEIAQVHTDDIFNGEVRVRGKGGKVRTVPLHPVVQKELDHLDYAGFLFPGKIDGHLSPGHVGKLIQRMLGKSWTAHTLRHRFASRAYAHERDLLAVQELLGHSKPETTKRYIAVPAQAKRNAVLGV